MTVMSVGEQRGHLPSKRQQVNGSPDRASQFKNVNHER